MSDLKKIQDAYSSNRTASDDIQHRLQIAHAALQRLSADEDRDLKSIEKDKRAERKQFYANEKQKLTTIINELTDQNKTKRRDFNDLAGGFLAQLDPVAQTAELDDAFPILMFPLRLETRFKSSGNTSQLWLRVYPDDCNINTKEDVLSESELNNARSFWIEIWKAGGIEAEERGAWRSLVNSHGSGRCAWIIRHYKPSNNKPVRSPDQKILVVTSSLALTLSEHNAAKNYWAAYWIAGGNATSITNAFNALVTATSNARAGEIRDQYIPINLGDVVPAGMTAAKVLLEKLDLPAYAASESSWTQAAKTTLLPDKFVVITYTGTNKKTTPFPNPVKDHLSVSFDPSLPNSEQVKKDVNGNLLLNEDVEWMADFQKAFDAGMAMRISLTTQEAANGFDKIFVVGLRFRSDKDQSKLQLEELLSDHFYSMSGLGLLRQGTPTNNTEDLPAGYSWTDDPDKSFDSIFLHLDDFTEIADLDKKSDGQKLADYIGIDPSILKTVPNANGRDQLTANAMNTALFPATLGYFMEEMMDPLFSERDIDATKAFFANFVSGRGPVPAVRIGKQPYGILPVSVYSKLVFGRVADDNVTSSKTPYLFRLHALLQRMDQSWNNLVPQVSFVGKDADPHQVLLDVVGLHPNSVEFHQRYSQTLMQLYNQLALQFGSFGAVFIAAAIAQRGRVILDELGIKTDQNIPILEKFFISNPNVLNGPMVDDVPESELNRIRAYSTDGLNYIQWLAESTAEKVRVENFGGNPAPTALLYLLLRHSLMLAQADAASSLLVNNNVVASKKVFYDPSFLHVQEQDSGKSKFEHLYNTYPDITGSANMKLAEHIYKPSVLQSASEAKRLNDTINALKILQNEPTAALERLLTEHLDCCNYRLDAWFTGLVNYKLTEQRMIDQQGDQFSKGIYLGAYGWLLDVRPANATLTNVQLSQELNEIFNNGSNVPLQADSSNLGYIHAPSLNQAATAAILRNAYDRNRDQGTRNPFAINLTSDRVRIAAGFLEGMRNGQSLSALLGYQFERGLHDKYSLGAGEVDMFIYPLRKAFPLVADNLVNTKSDASSSIEAIEARNVIDGIKLMKHVQGSSVKTYPYGLSGLPVASGPQGQAINDEVTRIIEVHDAISDLVVSEQVYQVVQGNFEKASGSADAFSQGNYPPDIDIMSTPRTGVTLTNRVAIHFDAEASPAASPNSVATMTPRAATEPSINKWLSDHFPDPQKVLCKVSYSSPVQAETEIEISQHLLGLQSIDLLYIFSSDTEQAMTELDDRITQYIRYNISHHPKTQIFIDYTKPIDAADRSKVSFFELSALIKSLRKIITGSNPLTAASIAVPQEGISISTDADDIILKTRINDVKNSLAPIQAGIDAILNNAKSISSLSDQLKTQLQVPITDTSKIESLITQLAQDLKNYLQDPVTTVKDGMTTAFENNISSIADPGVKATLKTTYGNTLDAYINDFANLDQLASDAIVRLMEMALYDNTQTGTGFIHDGILAIYNTVFAKLDVLTERWDKKKTDVEDILNNQFPAAADNEERTALLIKAEKIIASTLTFPVPPVANYKTAVDNTKTTFDTLLGNLKALKNNNRQKVTEFISDVEALIKDISIYDVMPFDPNRSRNDLGAEKLALALLKEDIVRAIVNIKASITTKTSACNALIADADATVVNANKITALLDAAKKILGDEALILPQFKLSSPHGTELENAYNAKDTILDFVKTNESRILPVEDWLGGIARVREKMHDWENSCFLSSAFKPAAITDLAPVQLPFKDDDRWFAMKFRDETDPNDKFAVTTDTLLYTAHFANGFDKTKPLCGVIVDEWTEVIPGTEETTGIAFHYNQPNSEPPQTMLLVVPPQITRSWSWDNIIASMEETLEMAKKRAVEPVHIEGTTYAQFLPSTMMAVTTYWITVATNLAINNYVATTANNN